MNPRDPDTIQRLWPIEDQPMVKIMTKGPDALSDAEVLSILIRKGDKTQCAVDLARSTLTENPGLVRLLSEPEKSRLSYETQARLVAAKELVSRALKDRFAGGNALNSPAAVREYLRLKLQSLPHEVFVALFLDAQNRVIEIEELFRGTLTQTSVYPREIVKAALKYNAGAVIFAHNHPSGIAEPSHADETLTSALKQALALVDVRVLDHFIVASANVISFAERGLI